MIQTHYQAAMKFAGEKHCDQKVPSSKANYLLHLSNVAMEVLVAYQQAANFDLSFAVQVAILHDVIEDTDTEHQELVEKFGLEIANAVLALTKNNTFSSKDEKMLDSLNRINQQRKEVGLVKLADRITNLQKPPAHWPKEKICKYEEQAKLIADQLANKNPYLNKRLLAKIEDYKKYS